MRAQRGPSLSTFHPLQEQSGTSISRGHLSLHQLEAASSGNFQGRNPVQVPALHCFSLDSSPDRRQGCLSMFRPLRSPGYSLQYFETSTAMRTCYWGAFVSHMRGEEFPREGWELQWETRKLQSLFTRITSLHITSSLFNVSLPKMLWKKESNPRMIIYKTHPSVSSVLSHPKNHMTWESEMK